MTAILLFLIVLFSGAICAGAGYWFYRASLERKKIVVPPQTVRRSIRNEAWDRAVQAARNRNW
jgi:hypothetical protein